MQCPTCRIQAAPTSQSPITSASVSLGLTYIIRCSENGLLTPLEHVSRRPTCSSKIPLVHLNNSSAAHNSANPDSSDMLRQADPNTITEPRLRHIRR
nr:hypothetical protein CFP56_33748 [Quercus suber]